MFQDKTHSSHNVPFPFKKQPKWTRISGGILGVWECCGGGAMSHLKRSLGAWSQDIQFHFFHLLLEKLIPWAYECDFWNQEIEINSLVPFWGLNFKVGDMAFITTHGLLWRPQTKVSHTYRRLIPAESAWNADSKSLIFIMLNLPEESLSSKILNWLLAPSLLGFVDILFLIFCYLPPSFGSHQNFT